MRKPVLLSIFLGMAMLSTLFAAACRPTVVPVVDEDEDIPADLGTLRIAVLPVLDTLPIYVAEKEGLFAKEGLQVEFIPVPSAPERDQIIAAGQADGMVNEALSTAFFNKDQISAQVVRYARAASSEDPLFRILVTKNSPIDTIEALKGVPIGISEATVIEYVADRLLQAEGFTPEEIQKIAVPKISDRMNLLGTGELQAAVLPEPQSSLAVKNGARLIVDDSSHPEYSFSTITFRKSVIDQKPEAVRGFLAAIEAAVVLINHDPSQFKDLLVDQKVVPPDLEGNFFVPVFVTAGVPSETQWNDVIAWAIGRGVLDHEVSYSESVNASFLP